MIARVATFNTAPPDDRHWVLEALHGVPGVHSCYHLLDPETGRVLSVSFYDEEAGIQAAVDAISARAREIGHQGPGPDEIRIYEVIGQVEND
jgi:hypothetical protein